MTDISTDPAAVERTLKRADKAIQRKQAHLALLREAYDYAMPERDAISRAAPGQQRMGRVFDSTAVVATSRFANRLQSVLCPPFTRWAMLKPGSAIPAGETARVAGKLEADTEILFAAVHASNFDTAFNEMAHDLAAGTGCLLIENGRLDGRAGGPVLRFTAVPSAEVAIEEGPFGRIEGVFHTSRIAARNLARSFPDAPLPEALARRAEDDPDAEIEVLQATCYEPETARWRFLAVERTGRVALAQRRYRTSPWVIVRWLKAPGEVEGRGPLIQALPDIKTLNKVVELVLKNASLAVTGVYTAADDGVLNPSTIAIRPGAVIPVARNGGPAGPSLAPLPRAGDFTVADLVIDRLQSNIKKMLFDNRLPPEAGPVRSATEIAERMRELAQEIGAAFGRMNSDGIVPIVARCIDILDEAGELALPLVVDGTEVAVVPTSPLARAQALDDVKAIADFVGLIAPFGPEVLAQAIKPGPAARRIAELMGVPASLIPSEAELAALSAAAPAKEGP